MPDGDHQLKRIVLPSGKTIEVVYFDHPAAAPDREAAAKDVQEAKQQRPEAPAKPPRRDLHVCLECESELVYPMQWEEADDHHWNISLRCPNCEWHDMGIFDQDACDVFDDELERGTDALTRDYRRLVTANLSEEIDRFAHALAIDGILPMDF